MQAQLQIAEGGATPYAAAADFGEVFTEEMNSLYLLSFLLTADKDKAEQCFIGALGENFPTRSIGEEGEWPQRLEVTS